MGKFVVDGRCPRSSHSQRGEFWRLPSCRTFWRLLFALGTTSVAVGGETLLVAGGGEPLGGRLFAPERRRSPLAEKRFWWPGGGEPLAVAVRAGTSSSPLAEKRFLVGRGAKPLAVLFAPERRQSPTGGEENVLVAGGGEPLAVTDAARQVKAAGTKL